MAGNMRENISMIRNKGMEYSHGQMDDNMTGSG